MVMRVLSTLVFGATLFTFAASAMAYSGSVRGACKADYKRFCAAHAIDDPGLRRCMDKAGASLSRSCVAALINSGDVSKTRAVQRWGHSF
ncbi:MAG: hypothetical protein AAF405_03040 [Pseudomonadota bacterium]